jgi:uroporphyrin-III C-methyltransferase
LLQNEAIEPGAVWLVGAGPGDADLLTVKALRLLRSADVVFYDALVSDDILSLIPDGVSRVPVGKRAGRDSRDQTSINALMLAAARRKKRVVRLKGGDPSVFGRSSEELAHLSDAGIDVFVCPGVTAASAVAAAARISLTERGVARRVQLITAQACGDGSSPLDWSGIADPASTIVIYMARSAAQEIKRQLIANGLSPETDVLVATNISRPGERLLSTRLDLLPVVCSSIGDAPCLVVVGEVAAQSAWRNGRRRADASCRSDVHSPSRSEGGDAWELQLTNATSLPSPRETQIR